MRTTAKITIFLILVGLIVSTNAFAQRGRGGPRGWRRGPADANAPCPQGFDQWAPGHPGPRGQFGPGFHQGPGKGFPMLRVLRRLDLTEEQHEQVRTILEDNKENAQTVEKGVRDAQKALHDAVINEAGEEAIRNAAAEVGTAIGNQAVLRTQTAASVKGVLTEEQLQKLDTIKEKMQEIREDMRTLQDELGPGQYRRGTG
ncbi:MAG: Spy/CpxP family protein refolding chaperone, partial [Planctomycetota bacterium]